MEKKQIYQFFADFIYQHTGIHYPEQNFYQLESRLNDLCRFVGAENIEEVHQIFKTKLTPDLKEFLLDLATNNETSFFRDQRPFKAMVEVCKELHQKNSYSAVKPLKIWSAACSTGQEPYSILMSLCESFPQLPLGAVSLKATDFSERVLKQCKEGSYSHLEVQKGLPIQLLMKYFTEEGERWRVNDSLKKSVNFSRLNLFSDRFGVEKFDLIFCRNVLIYQTVDHKKQIIENLSQRLNPGGVLILGSSENLLGISEDFKIERLCECTVYRKIPSVSAVKPLQSNAS